MRGLGIRRKVIAAVAAAATTLGIEGAKRLDDHKIEGDHQHELGEVGADKHLDSLADSKEPDFHNEGEGGVTRR